MQWFSFPGLIWSGFCFSFAFRWYKIYAGWCRPLQFYQDYEDDRGIEDVGGDGDWGVGDAPEVCDVAGDQDDEFDDHGVEAGSVQGVAGQSSSIKPLLGFYPA